MGKLRATSNIFLDQQKKLQVFFRQTIISLEELGVLCSDDGGGGWSSSLFLARAKPFD